MKKRISASRVLAIASGALLGGVMLTAAASGEEVFETFGLADQRVEREAKPAIRPMSDVLGLALDDAAIPAVMLRPVNVDALLAEDAMEQADGHKVLRYGVGRDVSVSMDDGVWSEVPGVGRLWTADVIASDAMGVRLHFTGMDLPPGANVTVRSLAHEERVAGPFTGAGLLDSGEFWSPTLFGDQLRVELFVPATANAKAQGRDFFRVDRIQHIYRDPVRERAEKEGVGDRGAGGCHNDVACYPGWSDIAKASAGIGYISNNSLWCSGTMLNTTANDQTPYWLTANHCTSTQSEANTVEIYWLYQRSSCGGTVPSLASVPQSGVCQLMATGSASDYTLLMIRGEIPNNLFWAGWTNASIGNGTDTTCVHHPSGDYKRISFGTKQSSSSNYVRINWYDGPTEPGSSGSGIFRSSTQQLYGQLCCGISACGSETWDDYGYFRASYNGMSSLLTGGSDDALENNDTCASAVSVSSTTYNNRVVKSVDEDWYRINVPFGQTLNVDLDFIDSYGDIDVELYDGCGGGVVASGTSNTNDESISYTNVGAGADFYIRVFLYSDTRNEYDMTIDVAGGGGSGNDDCANATPVTDGTITFSTIGATTDGPNEPSSCDGQVDNDIWYLYEATCNSSVTIDLCGSAFDTKLAVYASLACPSGASAVVCNDDFDCDGDGSVSDDGFTSRVVLDVTAGFDYLIRVGGYNGDSGVGQMTITCNDSAPVNDDCADALTIADGIHPFNTTGATTDGPAEPTLCDNSGDDSVQSDIWYRYTATCDGTATFDLCLSTFDTKIAVYGAGCPSSSAALACNDDFDCNDNGDVADDGYVSRVTLPVVSGQQYLLRIGGYNGETGAGTLFAYCTPGGPADCDGDANGDNVVDFDDLNTVLGAWGTSGPDGDVNDSGFVDFEDLNEVLGAWGNSCP